MKIKRLLSINAGVTSLAEAEKFFGDVLGAKICEEMPHGPYFGFRAKGAWLGTEEPCRLELIESTSDEITEGKLVKKMAPRYMLLTFEVENLDEAIAELRAKGVTVTDKKDYTPFGVGRAGWVALCDSMIHPRSSCGLGIELMEFEKGPAPGEW
ncbi:MAG: VOC family protein [Chloroflexi bacterium]|nr:VOC family protein [Chloroflexota bacterium]